MSLIQTDSRILQADPARRERSHDTTKGQDIAESWYEMDVIERNTTHLTSCDALLTVDKRSQAHPSDSGSPCHDWRPMPMRPPYMLFVIILSLSLAVLQECFYQWTAQHGAFLTFQSITDVSTGYFFIWRYLPSMIVISYGIVVATMDHQVMRLAPFYKLARPQGLKGADCLIREPLSYLYYLSYPLKAGPLMWISSLGSLTALVIVPLTQTASLASSSTHSPKQSSPPIYKVSVQGIWSRTLSAAFVLDACCVVALWIILQKHSNLTESPYGIAGVIATFPQEGFQSLTADLTVLSDKEEVLERLEATRFVLRNGKAERHSEQSAFGRRRASSRSGKTLTKSFKPPTYQLLILTCSALLLPGFYATLSFNPANVILEKASWFGTGIAVIYKLIWSQYEVYLRGLEPFHRLHRGQASADTIFIDFTGSPVLIMALRAMKGGYYLLATQGFCSVLVEFWVVSVASICDQSLLRRKFVLPTRFGMDSQIVGSFIDFWINLGVALSVPLVLGISVAVVWAQRRRALLPRDPGTISNILLYTQNTKLRTSLEVLRELHPASRERCLSERGKTYALGWFADEKQGLSLCIDEEPRVAPYLGLTSPLEDGSD